jgi:hypothetical protein
MTPPWTTDAGEASLPRRRRLSRSTAVQVREDNHLPRSTRCWQEHRKKQGRRPRKQRRKEWREKQGRRSERIMQSGRCERLTVIPPLHLFPRPREGHRSPSPAASSAPRRADRSGSPAGPPHPAVEEEPTVAVRRVERGLGAPRRRRRDATRQNLLRRGVWLRERARVGLVGWVGGWCVVAGRGAVRTASRSRRRLRRPRRRW